MDIVTVTTSDGLARLREDWERLERRDPHAPYYVTHRFVSAWWDAYAEHPDIELFVVCVQNNNQTVGIAPFSIRTETRKGEREQVLWFASHGDYLGVLVDPAQRADSVLRKVMGFLEEEPPWQAVRLKNIPGSSPLASYLFKTPYNREFRYHTENPYIDLRDYDGFGDYQARRAPSTARKYRNKLFREAEVAFTVAHGDEHNAFARIAALHRRERDFLAREQGREERHSLFEDPYRAAHVHAVFTGTDDAVTFMLERSDGELLGYRTAFRDGATLLSWNSAYHPDYDDYRVGKVLQLEILDYLLAQGVVDVFDFGAGRYPWKFEWTSTFTTSYRLERRLRETAAVTPSADPTSAKSPVSPRTEPESATAETGTAHTGESPASKPSETSASKAPTKQPRRARRLARRVLPHDVRRVLITPARSLRLLARRILPHRLRRALVGAVRDARGLVGRTTDRATAGPLGPPLGERRPHVAVWYVPHPDDEALFMAGRLAQHREGRNVVVLLTQGRASNALATINPKLDDPLDVDALSEARLREFRAAVAALGVPDRDVVRYDLPDGALDAADVREVVRNMARQFPAATHHTMSYLDPHPDHAAAGEAVAASYDDGEIAACEFHLPVPLVDEALGGEVTFDEATRAAKRAAVEAYMHWDPARGRYAVGAHSVRKLVERQHEDPIERVHGPSYEPAGEE